MGACLTKPWALASACAAYLARSATGRHTTSTKLARRAPRALGELPMFHEQSQCVMRQPPAWRTTKERLFPVLLPLAVAPPVLAISVARALDADRTREAHVLAWLEFARRAWLAQAEGRRQELSHTTRRRVAGVQEKESQQHEHRSRAGRTATAPPLPRSLDRVSSAMLSLPASGYMLVNRIDQECSAIASLLWYVP